MFRSAIPRSLLRPLSCTPIKPAQSTFKPLALSNVQFTSRLCTVTSKRPQPLAFSLQSLHKTANARRTSSKYDKPDVKHEKEVASHKLPATPELVSSTSSTHALFSELNTPEAEKEVDMTAGIKGDIKTIKETFDLSETPRLAYYFGLAGVLPYAATSLATVVCAYDINAHHDSGNTVLMSAETAEALLHILEPLQVGYGAVIISFLGAIHWGMEWANYGGQVGVSRYLIGTIAPAIAWPSTLLPVEYALISQFMAFVFMYYCDVRATKRGWVPPWYGTYRFALTFIVGAAIVVSLIGRGEVAHHVGSPSGATDRVKRLRAGMKDQLAKEEEYKTKKLAKEEQEKDENEE